MPDAFDYKVGPVLSFRGYTESAGEIDWKVTALIGVDSDAAANPKVVVDDGDPARAPVVLANRAGVRLLRYDLTVRLRDKERRVRYQVDGHAPVEFTVPGKDLAVRSAYVSCNGISDPAAKIKSGRKKGAVWDDLLVNHDRSYAGEERVLDKEQLWHVQNGHGTDVQRFHVLMMGGDQVYFDSIWSDVPELADWVELDHAAQLKYPVDENLRTKVRDYYFRTYCDRWNHARAAPGKDASHLTGCANAMARIPTVMMWDDHDIFDGWGSYSPELQKSEVARCLFEHAREAFWVYQLQQSLEKLPRLALTQGLEACEAPQYRPVAYSDVLKDDPLSLPFLDGQPGLSCAFKLGKVTALVLDLRTERSRKQIISEPTWRAVNDWLGALQPAGNDGHPDHLLVLSSVPVAYPKLSTAEGAVDFQTEHVVTGIADDLRDHWAHTDHEPERKRLVRILMRTAQEKRFRVSIVSGDVHLAACANIYRKDVTPDRNWLRVHQFISSAVVHPVGTDLAQKLFVSVLNGLARQVQAIDTEHACEMMRFPAHEQHLVPSRNWLALEPDVTDVLGSAAPRLWASWRCEGSEEFTNHLFAVHPAP